MKWRRSGFPWILVATLVAAVLLLLGLMLQLPPDHVPTRAKPLPALHVTNPEQSADLILRERLQLLDPTPLFLPSALSSSRLSYPQLDRDVRGSVLQGFPARLVTASWRPEEGRLAGAKPLTRGLDVISGQEVRLPFFGLGRESRAFSALPERWAVADVFEAKTHKRIAQLALPAPRRADFPATLWSPMDLLMIIAADGIVGEPEIISGTGVSEVDDYLVDAVRSQHLMGGGLRPGVYRLVVGR